ncbi:MAG: hypothetical protein AAB676_16015 [Verrucomicrobiota bacterium]
MSVRSASFALRIVKRNAGTAAIIYRRSLNTNGAERLARVAAIGPLAYSAGGTLLRSAVRGAGVTKFVPGPFYPLDEDSGARVACYSLVARGLRNASAMHHAAENIKRADGTEAAWWLGLMGGSKRTRAVRALRILVEAVK